jgi:hypothetical protein
MVKSAMDLPNRLNDQRGNDPKTVVDTYGQRSRTRDQSGRAQAQRRFPACFAGCCNVLRAARAAKVGRATHYQWMDEDPTYPARFREAQRVAVRALEDEAVRRAHDGERKLVTYKGKPVKDVDGKFLYETVRDSQLLMFLLKAYDRKRFGDKIDTTFGPNWNGNLEDLPEEFLRQVLAKLDAQAAAIAAKQIEGGASAVPAAAQTVDVAHAPSGQSCVEFILLLFRRNGVSMSPTEQAGELRRHFQVIPFEAFFKLRV